MMADVKALRALLDAATPGPWEVRGQMAGDGALRVETVLKARGMRAAGCRLPRDYSMQHADAALIAGAVNALPELLDEVEQLDLKVSEWISTYERQCTRSIATIRKLEVDIHDLKVANPTAAQMIAMQKELARLQSFIARTVENARLQIERLQLDVATIEIERDALRAEMLRHMRERDALRAEVERLRARVDAVGRVLSENGCDCDCGCFWDEHGDDCDRCLACRADDAIARREDVVVEGGK